MIRGFQFQKFRQHRRVYHQAVSTLAISTLRDACRRPGAVCLSHRMLLCCLRTSKCATRAFFNMKCSCTGFVLALSSSTDVLVLPVVLSSNRGGLSQGSCRPSFPPHSTVGSNSSSPSNACNMLCNVQHVKNMLLMSSKLWKRIPSFKILKRPFKMPKKHSTSLRTLSSALLHLISISVPANLLGGMRISHLCRKGGEA